MPATTGNPAVRPAPALPAAARPSQRRFATGARRAAIAAALAVVAVGAYLRFHGAADTARYVTAETSRGPIVRTITTTGAVDPVITVLVGAYVSGTIQSCYCDYNTQVKAGQLCAKIDPRPYQVIVDQDTATLATARAQLAKDQASLVYARTAFARDTRLLAHGVASQDTVDNDRSTLDQAEAQVKLDQATIDERAAQLHAAQVNLDYTDIRSPVDGTVVARNITIGQTVAASFQTPTLFLIAQDLKNMQIDTNVSESDVGSAQVGQKTTFTVEAFPGRTFTGTVSQIREAPITVQNVVTYNVVVTVDNSDLALLPGMTANTRIITDEREDVLRVPLQALRFSPQGVRQAGGRDKGEHGKSVWRLRDGRLERVPVTVGLMDASFAEIVHADLKPGEAVVVDEQQAHPGPGQGQAAPGPRRGMFHL